MFIPPLERLRLTGVPLYPSLLGLGTLTELTISDSNFDLHLDTLLDFLEGNHSLEMLTLEIFFTDYLLLESQRKNVMKNQLRHLSIECRDTADARALISSIPLRKGASLYIRLSDEDHRLSDLLPDVSTTHLSNPPSPTFFQLGYESLTNHIILDGAGGKLSFHGTPLLEGSFVDFAVLPLANVRGVHLIYREKITLNPLVFYPSYFPALETLTIDCGAGVSEVLSVLLSNSPPCPSLKTIGFLNCRLSEDFMEGLAKFASERRNSPTSTWLHRVQIVHYDGVFPSAASIRRLRKYVKVVEARIEDKFSMVLT